MVFALCVSHVSPPDPQAVAVRQRLESQYEAELARAKSNMAAEVKELTALLQEQGDQRLCQAQDR